MLTLALVALFAQFQGLNGQTLDANGLSLADKVEAIELRLLQPGSIDFGVSPCSNLLLDDPNRGEQTAAEWTRIIFHDAITANKAAGTGGLDGSISFESDREENKGVVFVNATIKDFAIHSSIYRSISDVIAMGLAVSMISCDATQPLIKLRAGRVDATGPGPSGVPGPFDSLTFATNAFAAAGFNQTEMIQSIACGHSLGAVHRANFKDIVGDDVTTAIGTDGADTFDSTPFVFDNTVVTEYLTNTGKRGGPLVVGKNESARSDFRIYNSDHNVTIQALAPANTFRSTCFGIFEKMLNTVPSNVVLSAPITPRQWLLREGHLDLDTTNAVRYSGAITTHSKTVTAPNNANWFFGTTGGGNTGTRLSSAGAPHGAPPTILSTAFGPITDYSFNTTLGSTPFSVTSFNIATASAATTAVYTRPINPNIFVLPSKSWHTFTRDSLGIANGQSWVVRAAVKSTLAVAGTTVTATIYVPSKQQGSEAPKYVRQTATLAFSTTRGNFKIYQAVITQATPLGNGVTHVDVRLGTQISDKVDAGLFGDCSTSPLINC